MATLIYSGTHGSSPRMTYNIYYTATRNRNTITVTFDITSTLNQYGALYTIGPVVFYGGSYAGSTQASTTIKERSGDQWGPAGSDGAPRYRSCSFTIDTLNSNMDLYFRIDVGDISSSHALSEQRVNISIPSYNPPGAPTWANISPNPCNINSRPTITWGGATAGSSGQILYDVEVRSTKPSGGWTDWLRIANSITTTSYYEIYLANMDVYGQTAYVGVQYQYRIRVYDGIAGDSGVSAWRETPVLSVDFTLPSAPNVAWNTGTIKRKQGATVNWSGANGGSGTITNYLLYLDLMPSTSGNIIKRQTYTLTGNSLYVDVPNLFPEAKNGNYIRATMYTNNSWGQQSSRSNYSFLLVKGNQVWIKINGSWKEGECYIKINGAWKEGVPYLKVNGNWKEST